MRYSFQKVYPFLKDENWLRAHGYVKLEDGKLTRLVCEDLNLVPAIRWDEYSRRLAGGWIPTLREFAEWDPYDQVRFEACYVYGFDESIFEKFSNFYITFWSDPLMAINYYDTLWAQLDLSNGLDTVEIYLDNMLALAGHFDSGGLTVDIETRLARHLEHYFSRRLVRSVVNGATVMVTYAGRIVFERPGPRQEAIDPVTILAGL
jgi:hypothetical protein